MIALDTNILVRYFVQDHVEQAALASDLLENQLTGSRQGFVATVTLLELSWVLQSVYSVDAAMMHTIISKILSVPNLVLESASAVHMALNASGQSFSDALIHAIGLANGCEYTLTFDRKFAQHDGVELLVRKSQ